MSVRFRKSIKLGPGVRMNVGKSGVGVSAGVRGARYSVHSSGRRTASVGAPGTGMSYRTSVGGSRNASRQAAPAPVAAAPPAPKPGAFAPAYEKAFAKAVSTLLAGDERAALLLFRDSSEKDSSNKALADDFFAGLLSLQLQDTASAIYYLERVVQSADHLPDALMTKYIPGGVTRIGVTDLVAVEVEFGTTCAVLALAEAYQVTDRPQEAIGLLQQLVEVVPQPEIVLALAELLAGEEAWDDVLALTTGYTAESDITVGIRIFQARALEAQGLDDAALEVYRDCLRSKRHDPGLLREARYRRAKLYIRLGKKAQARKDLGAVIADDPTYLDACEILESITQ